MEKLNFQHPGVNPSEIILIFRFGAKVTFIIFINVKNSCAAQYFCRNHDSFHNSLINRKKNQQNSIYLK